MNIDALIEDLKRDEGFRPHAYKDSEGHLTIGYGLLIDEKFPGAGLTKEEAAWLLERRVETVMDDLDRNIPWWHDLTESAKRALVNMAYQLGWPRLSGFHFMLSALEKKDYRLAANSAWDSRWAKQTPARAKRIVDLFNSATLET